MFLAYCGDCDERFLLSANHVIGMHNLEPGVIAVELTCYEGHLILLISGNDIDIPGPATV